MHFFFYRMHFSLCAPGEDAALPSVAAADEDDALPRDGSDDCLFKAQKSFFRQRRLKDFCML
jgi:hypothetical protein